MTSLGLNLIVGGGYLASDISRLLESCQISKLGGPGGALIDEVVITQTSEDTELTEMLQTDYPNVKLYYFPWVNDFSAARNFSFSKSTTDFIMWLDSDDNIRLSEYLNILTLKPYLNEIDCIVLQYNYSFDESGSVKLTLPRERIVRRCPEIVWMDPIHEYLTIQTVRCARFPFAIDHMRRDTPNPDRNLGIYRQWIIDDKPMSQRMKFYFGRELFDYGKIDDGVPILAEYESGDTDMADNKAHAAMRLARYWLYCHVTPECRVYIDKAKKYQPGYAEIDCLEGDYLEQCGDLDGAIKCFERALTKEIGNTSMCQDVDSYGYIPHLRLSMLCYRIGRYSDAITHAQACDAIQPDKFLMGFFKSLNVL